MKLRVEPNKELILCRQLGQKDVFTVAIITNEKNEPLDINVIKQNLIYVAQFDTFFGSQEIIFNKQRGGKFLK